MKRLLCILTLITLPGLVLALSPKTNNPPRVLIVPGHDDISYGASFRGIKEADMNVKLGLMLYDELKKKGFDVYITRDWEGYNVDIQNFFDTEKDRITEFINNSKQKFSERIGSGEVTMFKNVSHNAATNDTVFKLYGINLWANEHNMDAVIHIHFNDHPRVYTSKPGIYNGLAVYIPEKQLANSQISSDLAFFVFNQLRKIYPISNYELESGGIVPSQELIALGANDTSKTRSILVEYAYIYEPMLSTFYKREKEMKKMSKATALGIEKYFNYLEKK